MTALINLLKYSLSSVFWGIFIAVLCMLLFIFLIKGWYKDAQFSIAGIIVGCILFILLSIQCILITGSFKIIDTTNYYEVQFQRVVERDYPPDTYISLRQSDDIIKEIVYEHPILQYYIGGGEFTGFQAHQLPHVMAEELRSFMRWYVLRRLSCCLVFVVIAAFIVIKTMDRSTSRNRSRQQYERKRIDRRRKRRQY